MYINMHSIGLGNLWFTGVQGICMKFHHTGHKCTGSVRTVLRTFEMKSAQHKRHTQDTACIMHGPY